MKLSDTQRAILTAAAEHPDRLIQPPASPPAPRAQIARKFLDLGIAEECISPPGFSRFLWGGNVASGLRITDAGLRAIDIEPETPAPANTAPMGAEEPALRNADAPAPEANQDASLGDDGADPEDDRPRHERLGVDPALIDGPDEEPVPAPRASLRDAAQRVLAAWDDEENQRSDLADAIDALRLMLAKPSRTPREPGAPRKPREGTKNEAVLALLRRDEGATIAQIIEATGWQSHTVRGFLAGLKRKGITVEVVERIRQVGPNREGAKGSYSIYRVA